MEQIQGFPNQQGSNVLQNLYGLLCCKGGSAKYLCTSAHCAHNAFLCQNQYCQCISLLHRQCKSNISIKQLTNDLIKHKKVPPREIKNLFEVIMRKYDEAILKFSEERFAFMQYTEMFGLSKQIIDTITKLNEGKFQEVTGNTFFRIQQKFKKERGNQTLYLPNPLDCFSFIKQIQIQIQSYFNYINYYYSDMKIRSQKAFEIFKKQNFELDTLAYNFKDLQFIPMELNIYSKLKSLTLNRNLLKKIIHLENFPLLTKLGLNLNQLDKINNLQRLPNLERLSLSHNLIKKIQNLSKLQKLQYLNLGGNKIEKIENLERLTLLKVLNLSQNSITKIQNLSCLTNLNELLLDKNQIKKIENLDDLINLELLSFDSNNISKLENIDKLPKLKMMFLCMKCCKIDGNPLLQFQSDIMKIQKLKANGMQIKITQNI